MPYTNITSELVDSKIKKYEKIVEQFEKDNHKRSLLSNKIDILLMNVNIKKKKTFISAYNQLKLMMIYNSLIIKKVNLCITWLWKLREI